MQFSARLALNRVKICLRIGSNAPNIYGRYIILMLFWKSLANFLRNRYLDTLFVSIDANFRLKRKNVSTHESDPGLSKGYSYFVEETKYRQYLTNFVTEAEPVSFTVFAIHLSLISCFFLQKGSCSRHDAINLSESKPGQGHAATGVGAVVCSRHDMKRAGGVAQLQKGER